MDIIDNLYYGKLNEYGEKIDEDILNIEIEAYEEMKQALPEDAFEIVKKYLEKSAKYTAKLCAVKYKRGFQAGMLLAFESMKFDI